jgi:hypothetical protein
MSNEIKPGDIFEHGYEKILVLGIEILKKSVEAEVAIYGNNNKSAEICYYPLDKLYPLKYITNIKTISNKGD